MNNNTPHPMTPLVKAVFEIPLRELDFAVGKVLYEDCFACGSDEWPGNGFVNELQFKKPVIVQGLTGEVVMEHNGFF